VQPKLNQLILGADHQLARQDSASISRRSARGMFKCRAVAIRILDNRLRRSSSGVIHFAGLSIEKMVSGNGHNLMEMDTCPAAAP
jgi:hypothetical protein